MPQSGPRPPEWLAQGSGAAPPHAGETDVEALGVGGGFVAGHFRRLFLSPPGFREVEVCFFDYEVSDGWRGFLVSEGDKSAG